MADLNRADDQLTTTDFTARTSSLPSRRGLSEWIEADRLTATDAAGNVANNEEPWFSTAVFPAASEAPTGNVAVVTPLLPSSEMGELRSRWDNIQSYFVDEPRRSVQEADKLVANALQRITEGFANERASLEKQWDSGDSVSTEDLRIALQRYRAFFGRLLNAA